MYGGLTALPALAGGLVLGTAVALVGAARRWSAIVVVAVVVVVFVLAGGALAAPTTTIAGVVPTPATVVDLARGAASTWKQVLTLQPPVGSDGTLLAAAYLLALVGSCLAVRSPCARAPGRGGVRGARPVAVMSRRSCSAPAARSSTPS